MYPHRCSPARFRPTHLAMTLLAGAGLAWLAACGAAPTATPIPPTVAPTATAAPTAVPRSATATATPSPRLAATAVRPAPTPPVTSGGVLPTAQAFLTQVAGGSSGSGTPGASGTPGPQATVTGQVSDLDPVALTFTVRGTDGTTYTFLASATSQVDLVALANDLFSQQQVTVTYRGTTAPYEVIGVR